VAVAVATGEAVVVVATGEAVVAAGANHPLRDS